MGLESHVNRVLDSLGFKRRDWEWSFGDFIARSSVVAKHITDALNDEGQFKAERDGRYVVMSYTGRPSRRGRTPYGGGKRRKGGGPRGPKIPRSWPVQPLRPGQVARGRATCGTCGLSWDDDKSTSMTPTPSGRCPFEAFHRYGGKKRHAPSKSKLGGLVADINRLTK